MESLKEIIKKIIFNVQKNEENLNIKNVTRKFVC